MQGKTFWRHKKVETGPIAERLCSEVQDEFAYGGDRLHVVQLAETASSVEGFDQKNRSRSGWRGWFPPVGF